MREVREHSGIFIHIKTIIGSLVSLQGGSSIGLLTGPHNILINTGLPNDREKILKSKYIMHLNIYINLHANVKYW